LNIVRHFSTAAFDVSFTLSSIDDIFEVKVPRLQLTRGAEKASAPHSDFGHKQEGTEDETSQKKDLRREIKKWWEGVADHIDKIVKFSLPELTIS
jgi:1-phosphatidylinositol-3-phosphate 5-kinase